MRLLVIEKSGSSACSTAISIIESTVTKATSAEEAIRLLQREAYDVVLLDMTSAILEGLDLIRRLRALPNLPILVVTGETAGERVAALALGADDAVPASIDPGRLRARIASALRRRRGVSGSLLTVGNVTLCRASRDAFVSGTPVRLTDREYVLLEYLAMRKDKAIGKDVLLTLLFAGINQPEARIIDVFICKVRRKLQCAGADSLITTVWGHGYTFHDQRYRADDEDRQLVA